MLACEEKGTDHYFLSGEGLGNYHKKSSTAKTVEKRTRAREATAGKKIEHLSSTNPESRSKISNLMITEIFY